MSCNDIDVIPDTKNYSWEELISYCVDVYSQLQTDGFVPEVIICVSRGGFFPGLVMSHLCKTQLLYSVRASTNVDEKIRSERKQPIIESLFTRENINVIQNKKILIIDDVFNTGLTIKAVYDYLKEIDNDLVIKTACMVFDTYSVAPDSDKHVVVDYYSDKRCAWAVFPWETVL